MNRLNKFERGTPLRSTTDIRTGNFTYLSPVSDSSRQEHYLLTDFGNITIKTTHEIIHDLFIPAWFIDYYDMCKEWGACLGDVVSVEDKLRRQKELIEENLQKVIKGGGDMIDNFDYTIGLVIVSVSVGLLTSSIALGALTFGLGVMYISKYKY